MKKRKSPIKFTNTKVHKMGGGGSDLKATQKMFGVVKPATAKKMKTTEKARKSYIKTAPKPLS